MTPPRRHYGKPRPQRHRSKIVIGVGLVLAVILLANAGGGKSKRPSQRQLAVQDLGGTQQVQIQQGNKLTVIEQHPDSSQPVLKVHDSGGVQVASKYKPLDTPGIGISKGRGQKPNTVINIGEGSSQQTIEMLRQPSRQNTDSNSNSGPLVQSAADTALAHSISQDKVNPSRPKIVSSNKAQLSPKEPAAGKSSFHGGGNTLDSATSDNKTAKASADQKQAMAATDRLQSSTESELFSSTDEEDFAKDPASRRLDNPIVNSVSSAADSAAAMASGVKNAMMGNDTEDLCSETTLASLPHLKLEQLWKTTRSGFDTDVSLVTQLSLDKLDMLQAQCELWSGPIAAVVYVPLLNGKVVSMDDASLNGTTRDEQHYRLALFHDRVTKEGPCRLTLEMVSEQVESAPSSSLYPYNALRNHALLLVKTEIVLLLDVEFLPPEELSRIFSDRQEYQSTLVFLYNNAVIVLPAFETLQGGTLGQSLAMKLAKGSKVQVLQALVNRQLRQYQVAEYEKGQRASNYTNWLTSKIHYAAKFEEGYEPFMISARKNVPWYDERFRGQGRDRIVQVLNMAGFVSFTVHPTVYLLRQPHPVAPSTLLAKSSRKYKELGQTYSGIRASILAGQYQPVSVFSCGEAAVTSYTEADMPTHTQFSEAAFAANQAVAGRLAALQSQGAQTGSRGLDAAQQLQKAQRESAQQHQVRAANSTASQSQAEKSVDDAETNAASLRADQASTSLAQGSSGDVAAQLQKAQQHSQQQAADFKQQHDVVTATVGSISSSAADADIAAAAADGAAALTEADDDIDPAARLQQGQLQQPQEASALQSNHGSVGRLQAAESAELGMLSDSAATSLDPKLVSAAVDDSDGSLNAAARMRQAQQQQAVALQQDSDAASLHSVTL